MHLFIAGLLYVDLSENTISNLPANSFINASSLYWLDLAANKITNVNENAFKGLLFTWIKNFWQGCKSHLTPRMFRWYLFEAFLDSVLEVMRILNLYFKFKLANLHSLKNWVSLENHTN